MAIFSWCERIGKNQWRKDYSKRHWLRPGADLPYGGHDSWHTLYVTWGNYIPLKLTQISLSLFCSLSLSTRSRTLFRTHSSKSMYENIRMEDGMYREGNSPWRTSVCSYRAKLVQHYGKKGNDRELVIRRCAVKPTCIVFSSRLSVYSIENSTSTIERLVDSDQPCFSYIPKERQKRLFLLLSTLAFDWITLDFCTVRFFLDTNIYGLFTGCMGFIDFVFSYNGIASPHRSSCPPSLFSPFLSSNLSPQFFTSSIQYDKLFVSFVRTM